MEKKIIVGFFTVISWLIGVSLLFYVRNKVFHEQLFILKFTILDGTVLIAFYTVFKCYTILSGQPFFKFFPWLVFSYIIFYILINPLNAMMAPLQKIEVNTLYQTLFIILFWESVGAIWEKYKYPRSP